MSKILEAKVKRINTLYKLNIKINNDGANCINIYTDDNHLITSGKLNQVDKVLDALITIKNYENDIK